MEITRTREDEVREDLLSYALAKLDEPLAKWKKITPDELISTGTILAILADPGKPIEEWISAERHHLSTQAVVAERSFTVSELLASYKGEKTVFQEEINYRRLNPKV